MYTYASNVRMIDLSPEIFELEIDKIGDILSKQLSNAYSETEKEYPDCEIQSHSLLLLSSHLVVSFLLCHRRG
jgi:hypothetical protein